MYLNIENKTKQNKTCAIFCSVCECVCVCSSSISLDSDDDTVWHLRRSPCDLNIQSHILFCTVRLFSFPFSQCDCEWILNASKRTNEKIYFLFQTKAHSCVCINVLLHHRMDFDGMFGSKTNTRHSVQYTALSLALSLARCALYCLYTPYTCMKYAVSTGWECVLFVRCVCFSFSISRIQSVSTPV